MSNATDDKLRLLIERVERVNEEIADLNSDRSDIFAEAKGEGYDTKIMREIIKLRKMKPDDRMYFEEVLETYKCALGMDGIPQSDARMRQALDRLDADETPITMSVNGGPEIPVNRAAVERQQQAQPKEAVG